MNSSNSWPENSDSSSDSWPPREEAYLASDASWHDPLAREPESADAMYESLEPPRTAPQTTYDWLAQQPQQEQGRHAHPSKSNRAWLGQKVAILVATAVVAGGVGSGLTLAATDGGNGAAPIAVPAVTADGVVNQESTGLSSVLTSTVTVAVRDGGNNGSGSGVAISPTHVVTNAHVVTLGGAAKDPESVAVRDSAGREYAATVVGVDAVADVAVLNVPDLNAPAIKWGDSSKLTAGQGVIAIGAPLGLSNTVTSGIVSALNRPVALNRGTEESAATDSSTYINAIQTDAAINRGNSGGALIDTKGRLVGLNVAIASSGDSQGNIGIGYAIPATYVKRVAQELIENGQATHGLIGVNAKTLASKSGSFEDGAVIEQVSSNSPAERAGLKAGDVIVGWDGAAVSSASSLIGFAKSTAPDTEVEVTVRRGNSTTEATVKVASDQS